ncbi:MAG: hypothetical protein QM783_09280 [Phycisphaerales bacterium]
MLDVWVIMLAVLFFLCVPGGLILLALGLFSQHARTCSACRYDRAGLRKGTPCPECGAPAAAMTYKEVLRNSWQVRIGIALLVIAAVPMVLLMGFLVRAAL